MKRTILILCVLSVLLFCASCQVSTNPDPAEDSTATETERATQAAYWPVDDPFGLETTVTVLPEGSQPFAFTCEVDAPEGFVRGKPITFTVTMKNVSGQDFTYYASESFQYAFFRIYCENTAGERYEMDLLQNTFTELDRLCTIKADETKTRTLTENIPQDAPIGDYDVQAFYALNEDWAQEFENVFSITE